MRRRDFIKVIASSAVAWPLVAHAQQAENMRRIAILFPHPADDPQGQTRLAAFLQELQLLGWSVGRNVLVDTRWGAGDADRYRKYAAELVAFKPDVIVANTSPIVAAVQQATSTIPIVFVGVIDAVGGGFVSSLARPGGNTTGFPEMTSSFIAAGTYPSLRRDYQTLGIYNFAVARPDLPESLAYAIVQAVFTNYDEMIQIHPTAAETVAANFTRNTILPFHAGAARWYNNNAVAGSLRGD